MSGRLCARGPYEWSEGVGRWPPTPARGRAPTHAPT
nr:MAG TPA: hypothetical protein [Caudoviricetes sp.]